MSADANHDSSLRALDGSEVFPLCLGGNVFGWTTDRHKSFAVLDAYVEAGGNFIDTADLYMQSVPGMSGGESESIIGDWLASRGGRERLVIATKVGKLNRRRGLSPANVRLALEDSLRRLRTDYVDLYYAHEDDESTPMAETLGAFTELQREHRIRYLGASNFSAQRLARALEISISDGLARYQALQPSFNLIDRGGYPRELEQVCRSAGISCIPYFGLAKGFLTGKYRQGGPEVDSARAAGARAYLDARGVAVLDALDEVAAAHRTTVAAIALAWLLAQPTVIAPIASARTPEQLSQLLPMANQRLSGAELNLLDKASFDQSTTTKR